MESCGCELRINHAEQGVSLPDSHLRMDEGQEVRDTIVMLWRPRLQQHPAALAVLTALSAAHTQ
jgi:hypothetical protein